METVEAKPLVGTDGGVPAVVTEGNEVRVTACHDAGANQLPHAKS